MAALSLLLVACSGWGWLDPDDRRLFGPSVPLYRPAGLDCGLANRTDAHYGGSCADGYDPAHSTPATGTESAGPHDAPCPEGLAQVSFTDRESYSGAGWYTCAHEGTLATSSGSVEELPQGAACGLGMLSRGQHGVCEGYATADLTCPAGFVPRWVVDHFQDRALPGTCRIDPAGDFGPLGDQVDVLVFCEAAAPGPDQDGGCTEGTCASGSWEPGLLCGLHNRGGGDAWALDVEAEELPLADLTWYLDGWLAACAAEDPFLAERMEALAAAATVEPACLGRPVAEGCPEGLALVCTSDWVTEPDGDWPVVARTSLCWCDGEGQGQWMETE